MNVVVDPYDTTPQNAADTSLTHYFPASLYSHPDSQWHGHEFEFGEEGNIGGFLEHHHHAHIPGDLSWDSQDFGHGAKNGGLTSLTSHNLDLDMNRPELDLPLSDHSYPASSDDTGSPASGSSRLLYPAGFTPDDEGWHRADTDGHGHSSLSLLPPLQLVHPALALGGQQDQNRHSHSSPPSSFTSPSRRALNMPYHELSPRATPSMGGSANHFTPKAAVVKPYPLVLSHSDMTSHIESPDLPQGHRRCVPLSELTAAYIPSPTSTGGQGQAKSPAVGLRTSSMGALGVHSEGVQPARLVGQHTTHTSKRPRAYSPSVPSSPSEGGGFLPAMKRPRIVSFNPVRAANHSDAEDGESEVDDEDMYLPSRSPSPAFSGSDYSDSYTPRNNYRSRNSRNKRRGGGKGAVVQAISAADALRLAQASSASTSDESEVEPKARKNSTIPIPIPIPHLTKKSRGRKVPYVDTQVSRSNGGRDEEEDDEVVKPARGTSSRRGRGGRGGARTGERSFVCSVPGCGKCFVRGEHLKRHIRSIHTHEKPYPCPYEGCQKSFSRRDNLGQHVRLHFIAV